MTDRGQLSGCSFSIPLIDRNGKIVKRFHPTTTPEAIDAEIGTLLTKQEK